MNTECIGCSNYSLTVIDIFPFEYCHRFDVMNHELDELACYCTCYDDNKILKIKNILRELYWSVKI